MEFFCSRPEKKKKKNVFNSTDAICIQHYQNSVTLEILSFQLALDFRYDNMKKFNFFRFIPGYLGDTDEI